MVVVQGVLHAVICGCNEPYLGSWRNLIRPKRLPTINAMGSRMQRISSPGKRKPRRAPGRPSIGTDSFSSLEDLTAGHPSLPTHLLPCEKDVSGKSSRCESYRNQAVDPNRAKSKTVDFTVTSHIVPCNPRCILTPSIRRGRHLRDSVADK